MTVTGKKTLEQFIKKHARAKASVSSWLLVAESAEWETPQDIKNRFNSVDFLKDNRVIFNIGGNNYRLVVIAYYVQGSLLVDRIGTHAEYDKWKLE